MVKVDIVSGFLGAGKTTLIKKLLSEAFSDTKVVLIENEFGEIGIDGGFLQESGVAVREMNSGCICCSLSGDFKTALQEVLTTYAPERILIEPSGVGKLSDVVHAVESVEADLQIANKMAVVDVNKCKLYLKNFGEFFLNQVETADTILLSRTDQVRKEKVQQVVDLLREHNTHALIVTTPWDALHGSALLAELEQKQNLAEDLLHAVKHDHRHEHEHHDHHEHDHHEHDHHEHAQHKHEHTHTHGEGCSCGHHHAEDATHTQEHHEHHEHHNHDHHEHAHHKHEHMHVHGEACSCGHHHADEVFASWGMETPAIYDTARVHAILEALEQTDAYGNVLRAKGMLDAGDGTWIYYDYVPGEVQVRTGDALSTGKVCVIGTNLQKDALAKLFA